MKPSEYAQKFHAKAKARLQKITDKRSMKKVLLVRKVVGGHEGVMFEEEIWNNPDTKRRIQVVQEMKRRGFKPHDGSDITIKGYSVNIEIKKQSAPAQKNVPAESKQV